MANPNNVTCGVSPVTNVGPACSGHGDCVFAPALNRGVCVCHAGWQGESDFQVTNSLLDCQINVTAVRVLWGVALGVLLLVFVVFHVPYARWLLTKHRALVAKNKAAGRKYTLFNNKGLFALTPYLVLAWPAQIALAILKVVNQDLKLGASVPVTVLYIIWRFGFFFGPDIFQPNLLKTLLKTERNLDHIIKLNWHFNLVHLVFIESVSILTIIPLVVKVDPLNPVVGMTSFAVFANLIVVAFAALAIQARYIGHRVQVSLVSSYALTRDERTNKIMTKIRDNQRTVIKGCIIQTFVFALYGWFPYMWNKHDYLVPITLVFASLQVSVALKSLVQEEDKQSSTKPTSPSQVEKKVPQPQNDSSVADSATANKEPFVHGLDLEPLNSHATKDGNTIYSSGEGEIVVPPPPTPGSGVRDVAIKLLRSLTPSRKEAAKQRFDFSQEEDEENK